MILDLQNINKSYGEGKLEVPVLFDIDLQVEAGEYVAIMGPSCLLYTSGYRQLFSVPSRTSICRASLALAR